MKYRTAIGFVMLCATFIYGSQKVLEISTKEYPIQKNSAEDFFKIGRIEKIVKPESTEASVFGDIGRIKVLENGEIYILDRDNRRAIFKFDPQGKFLKRYGQAGQGPGEYQYPISFDVGPGGDIYLLTHEKIIVYSSQGQYEMEIPLDYMGADIHRIDQRIYTGSYMTKGYTTGDLIREYDPSLKKIKGILQNDPRMLKYRFVPYSFSAVWRNSLVFMDAYDLAFNIYEPKTNSLRHYFFPNDNSELSSVWEKKSLTEDDRKIIKKKMNRFIDILSNGIRLVLFESDPQRNAFNLWLVDLDGKIIQKYPWGDIQGESSGESSKLMKFDYFIGIYQYGLIFAIDSASNLARVQKEYPEFKNIVWGEDDNELLVFYRLKIYE